MGTKWTIHNNSDDSVRYSIDNISKEFNYEFASMIHFALTHFCRIVTHFVLETG